MTPSSHVHFHSTPLGTAEITTRGDALDGVRFVDGAQPSSASPSGIAAATAAWLDAYFAGRVPASLPTLSTRGTPFQRRVWNALLAIPAGETISYARLAQRLASPRHTRAVAAAVARNPWWILVPCHRVIGSDGSLTGYAGGLPVKRALLALEGAAACRQAA